jgi:ABC-type lipoprotein release transport system permease subunit
MALGASAMDVLRLIVRSGMYLAVIGVLIGLAGAFAITRLMTSLLFGVSPTDVMTFALVTVGLLLVALAISRPDARRKSILWSLLDTNELSPAEK